MGGGQVDTEPGLAGAALVPHLPRLVIDWLATEPGTTHREIEGTVVL
jgi:hypothetical protein